MQAINAGRTGSMLERVSSRSWGYILEGMSRVDKDEIVKVERALNDCSKLGYLPLDFVADDQDETRRFDDVHEALNPDVSLMRLLEDVDALREGLPPFQQTTGRERGIMCCAARRSQ